MRTVWLSILQRQVLNTCSCFCKKNHNFPRIKECMPHNERCWSFEKQKQNIQLIKDLVINAQLPIEFEYFQYWTSVLSVLHFQSKLLSLCDYFVNITGNNEFKNNQTKDFKRCFVQKKINAENELHFY